MLAVMCRLKTFYFFAKEHIHSKDIMTQMWFRRNKGVNKDVLMSHSQRILEVIKSLNLLKWKRYWYSLRNRLSTQQGCSSLVSFLFQLGVLI